MAQRKSKTDKSGDAMTKEGEQEQAVHFPVGARDAESNVDEGIIDDGVAMILDYLRTQNRPYSKTSAAKILKDLHQKQQVEGRASGKQLVYHALQSPEDDASPEIIASLDDEITQLQDQVTELKAREKEAKMQLSQLAAQPVLSEVRQDVARLEAEKDSLLKRLALLHGQAYADVSVEEKARVAADWKQWQRHVNARKRICRELWCRCSEVVPEDMTRQELWETLGLEGDME